MKNTVERIKSRLHEAEDRISELEDKVEKNTQKEQEKEKRLRKNEEGLREMQDNMKCNNILILGIPEGEEEQGIENLFEKVMMENFPNLRREKITHKKQEKEKRLRKNEEVIREMQDNMKRNNIRILGIPEGEEEQGRENLFEKVKMEKFPNLMREKVTQIQETQRIPSKGN